MDEINSDSVIPLYHQLKEIIRNKIISQALKPGDMIDSEHRLVEKYKVGRNTVKKALEDLVYEGILQRIQGKGTFVSHPKLEQSLSGFYSFSKVMKSKGIDPKDIIVKLEHTSADLAVTRNLDVQEGTRVIKLQRLRCANNEPIMFETSYVIDKIIPELTVEMLKKDSLYDLMLQHGVVVSRAKESFEPIVMGDYEAKYLEVKKGYPALLLHRLAYAASGQIVEYCTSIVRGDRCRFYTELL